MDTNNLLKQNITNLLADNFKDSFDVKDQNAICLMTGGIDSSICAEICIKYWNTTIYPLYIKRGAKAEEYELIALNKVLQYLTKKYPNNIKPLIILEVGIPHKDIKSGLSEKRVTSKGHPLRNNIMQCIAVQYGCMLNDNGTLVSKVLIGSVASDFFPGSRKEDLLVNTFYACMNLEEWDWRIFSPMHYGKIYDSNESYTKSDLILWGEKNVFPFDITRTCTSSNETSCSKCHECEERINTFKTLNIVDTINY